MAVQVSPTAAAVVGVGVLPVVRGGGSTAVGGVPPGACAAGAVVAAVADVSVALARAAAAVAVSVRGSGPPAVAGVRGSGSGSSACTPDGVIFGGAVFR